MSKEVFVFEVSHKSFEQYVLLNSHKIPAVVEFMGSWSGPSIIMSEMFEDLATEFAEEFIFAKVDVDEQEDLKTQYDIKNIPTTIVFKDGEPVRREEGQLGETEARQLLKDFGIFNKSEQMREEAREKHLAGDTPSAIMLLAQAIKNDPSNTRIAMDMIQIFMDLGELEQASALYEKLPEAVKQTDTAKALTGQMSYMKLAAKTAGIDALNAQLASNADDFDAHFDLAICLVAQYKSEEAMDHLFYIFENKPEYKDGAAKELIITLTDIMASVNDELAQSFRRRLANTISN